MNPFQYQAASTEDQAVGAVAAKPQAAFIAGGTTLVDLMKLNVMTPAELVDINALPMAEVTPYDGGLRIGALARMSDVARAAAVVEQAPLIAESLLASASPQLRNMATIGGNLLQRTRCSYFRDTSFPCNKRNPGSGCSALDGENRQHAILGTSEHCIATHPSDLAVALAALEAIIHVRGVEEERDIAFKDFYRLPEDTPHLETSLRHGELIVHVDVPTSSLSRRSHYLKLRDRSSYEFALVSVAVCLQLDGGNVRDCRLALGGVGTKPWRATAAEAVLNGKPSSPENFARAAEAALQDARPREQNAFKVPLAKRAIVRALEVAAGKK